MCQPVEPAARVSSSFHRLQVLLSLVGRSRWGLQAWVDDIMLVAVQQAPANRVEKALGARSAYPAASCERLSSHGLRVAHRAGLPGGGDGGTHHVLQRHCQTCRGGDIYLKISPVSVIVPR